MPKLKLVIANKNISSWSMRPWVLLTEAKIAFEEVFVPFDLPGWAEKVGSPSGRVPLLIADDLRVWDSLAIAEYVNELFPEKKLWPDDAAARAQARCASAEMHSGFPDLRNECSMDLVHQHSRELSAKAAADVRRVDALLSDCRQRFGSGGELLFGRFSIADAMFAPVASRARTYGLKLSQTTQRYLDALWNLHSVQQWAADAEKEVASGIVERSPHGKVFSHAEAEKFAAGWVDRLNAKQFDALLELCAEEVQMRGAGGSHDRASMRKNQAFAGRSETGKLKLESCSWDGDLNRLTLCIAGAEGPRIHRRAEMLSFDSAGRVRQIDTFDS